MIIMLTHLPTAEKANNNNPWAAKDSPLNIPEFDIYPVWRKKLFDYGLNEKVINKLEESFKTGGVSGKLIFNDLDVRALDALKYFPPEGAVDVLDQFMESNLEHVYNKSAYLCSIMKTYKMRTNIPPPATAPQPFKGPEESKIKAILKRTRYTLDVTTGQRKYGGPPPNWEGPPPPNGCEIFVGKIPRDIYEDKLIPLFEKCGQIWDLRLIMDPLTGHNRGFAFITFTTREAAQKAVKQVDGEEIKKGKFLRVTASVPNIQLFVGNIPKSKGRSEIMEEFSKLTSGLKDVIVYSSPDDPKKKNRGFCFLEYDSHRSAAMAKRRLGMGRMRIWGCDIIVDWADPQEEPDQETMSKVKVLYVSNLAAHVTEEALKQMFEAYGKVERVKKLRDYAFVHFESRDDAMRAMEGLHHKDLGNDILMSVSLAKPALDSKKKEEMLRNRERRMMQTMQQRAMMMGILPPFVPPPPPPPMDRVGQSRSNSASGSNSRIFYN
ncbi:HNRNPR, partial [Cordylochernes scorpioides]